jgi:hypothetical protein
VHRTAAIDAVPGPSHKGGTGSGDARRSRDWSESSPQGDPLAVIHWAANCGDGDRWGRCMTLSPRADARWHEFEFCDAELRGVVQLELAGRG